MENRGLIIGAGAGVLALLCAVAGTFWFVAPLLAAPDAGPRGVAAEARGVERQPRRRPATQALRTGRNPDRAELRTKMRGRGPGARPEPGARREEREQLREERMQELESRIDQLATAEGWDPQKTEQVRGVILETQAHIRDTIQDTLASGGDRTAAREEMESYRTEQGRVLLDLVGPEAFPEVVDELGVERLFADHPTPARRRPQ